MRPDTEQDAEPEREWRSGFRVKSTSLGAIPAGLAFAFDDMSAQPNKVDFVAVLIYEDGENRYSEEPHVISASHPEIAYQIAMSRGAEQRYGRRFVGLSHLEPAVGEIEPIACSRGGNANDYVSPKSQLAAFSDPRWSDVECTEEELAEALREPPLLVELEGLNDIPWQTLTHAYGPAVDVPTDLRRIGSSDPQLRENAVWQLGGSIYHQGTLYPATASAIPFLIRLATNHTLPNRGEICGLLEVIAESCAFEADEIRKAWAWRKESFGETYDAPSEEMAEREIASYDASRAIMMAHLSELQSLADDDDGEVAEYGREILEHLGQGET